MGLFLTRLKFTVVIFAVVSVDYNFVTGVSQGRYSSRQNHLESYSPPRQYDVSDRADGLDGQWKPVRNFTVFQPLTVLKDRGGKKLNVTLPLSSSSTSTLKPIRARIINTEDDFRDTNYVTTDTNYDWPKFDDDEDCVCIPEYLCKDGRVASEGLILSALKIGDGAIQVKTNNGDGGLTTIIIRGLLPRRYGRCGPHKVCCDVDNSYTHGKPIGSQVSDQEDYPYPVATPIPDNITVEEPVEVCGVRHAVGVRGRIVSGGYGDSTAEYGEFPWQVALLKKIEQQRNIYICGGVLISYEWIATAAHCVNRIRVSQLQIRLGEWDVEREDELYTHVSLDAEAIIIHPEFSPFNLHNDIALVRIPILDPGLPHVSPACLPESQKEFVGQDCWVSGWGKNAFGKAGIYQSILKKVDVPVLQHEDCEKRLQRTELKKTFRLFPGFLCAGGKKGKDACTGDGGSALVCEKDNLWYVVGLVSWGIACGLPEVPGVYVNMNYYLNWIYGVILR